MNTRIFHSGNRYVLSRDKKKGPPPYIKGTAGRQEYQRAYYRDRIKLSSFRQRRKKVAAIRYVENGEKLREKVLRYYYAHREEILERRHQAYREQKDLAFNLFFYVHRNLPEWWNPDMRDDVRQTMLVDILNGNLSLLEVRRAIPKYLVLFFKKNRNWSHNSFSFDAPISHENKMTFAEVISLSTNS